MTAAPWLAVVNPGAGRRSDTPARTRRALGERSVEAEVTVTESAEHLRAIVGAGAVAGRTRFLAVGGDGTVNLVVDELMRHDWPAPPLLGILPGGSGCDFIRTFGISQQLERAAAHLVDDQTYRVDVGRLRGPWGDRYFLNVAQAGLGAAVVRLADRLPARMGALRYKVAIWPTLVRFPRAQIELTVGERRYEGPAMMVVLANAQFFGGGMNVAPKAMLGDGALDVQVFQGPKRLAVMLQPRLTRGTHLTHPSVRRWSASTIRLGVDWPLEADGEFLGRGGFEASVVPGALDVKI